MKKLVISTIVLLTYIVTWGQKENISNSEVFSSQSGTLIEKEFIDIGKISKTEVQILKITDMISGASIKSLRITTEVKSSYSTDTKIAQLDSDEIDGLIKSLSIIEESIFGTIAPNYTEVTFKSRTGFEAGCFWSRKSWSTYLQVEKNDRKSMVHLNKDDFNAFLDLLVLAKSKI